MGSAGGGDGRDPGERGGDLAGPGARLPGCAASGGEFSLQGKQLQPGDEVGGDRCGGAPDVVVGEVPGRQPAQPGVLRAADAVLDAGMRPVAGVEPLQLFGGGVGDERGVTPPWVRPRRTSSG
jgi:hypothetical protein